MRRKAKYQIYKDTAGLWRWRLKAANGRTLSCGESHKTKLKAYRALCTNEHTIRNYGINLEIEWLK